MSKKIFIFFFIVLNDSFSISIAKFYVFIYLLFIPSVTWNHMLSFANVKHM